MFKCSCGKSFKHPYSLQKHTKECDDELASIDGRLTEEDILGEEDDSDTSELSESASNRMDDTLMDCIGNTTSQNWLIIEDNDLCKINCMINKRMRLIICRGCDKAVPPEHLQTHVTSKHKIYCSHDVVESIVSGRRLMTLDSIIELRENMKQLESPIGGIPVRIGYKCLKCGCCVRKWDSMTAHFRKKHKGENVKEWSEDDVDMQLVFGGRLKRWFPIHDRSMVEVDEGNESAWLAAEVLLAKRRRWVTRQLKEREENMRLINGFMVHT